MSERVLIIGGYGVFGARLAKRLAQEPRLDIVVAGRSRAKAADACADWGGTPYVLDRDADGDLERALTDLAPRLVIDAAGPFQAYGADPLRVARKAIEAGAHYLDLADDRDFVVAIGALDRLAKERGVAAIAGASSIPALSGAAADALAAGLDQVAVVDGVIVPGNRAPRGLSVVRAILSQVGRPLRIWRGGCLHRVTCWGWPATMRLSIVDGPVLSPRWASFIGAPDYDLFPGRYGATSVLFRAGLELRILHGGLWLLGWLVRLRLLRSLAGLARPTRLIAERLKGLGTDRGAMAVSVAGRDGAGNARRRTWTLIVEAGDGPNVPPTPAFIVARKILSGSVDSGARPCLGLFTLDEAEAALRPFAIRTGRRDEPAAPLFERALGDRFHRLPAPVQDLHDVFDRRVFVGHGRVQRGRGLLARLCAALAGFPPAAERLPVTVEKVQARDGERWTRRFGRHVFRSRLSRRPRDPGAVVWERFGVLSFEIALRPDEHGLEFPVRRGRLLGIPLPSFAVPVSRTRESVDSSGAVRFDVEISLRTGSLIARYAGVLESVGPGRPGEPSCDRVDDDQHATEPVPATSA